MQNIFRKTHLFTFIGFYLSIFSMVQGSKPRNKVVVFFLILCLFVFNLQEYYHGVESECPNVYHRGSSRFREVGNPLCSGEAIADQLRCFSVWAQAFPRYLQ